MTEGAFRALYDEHFPFVWRCLRGLGVRDTQLEDAAQEVFVVAHRKLAEFRGDSAVRTWLYGILRYVAANQRRSQRRKGSTSALDPELASDAPTPEQRVQQRQRAQFVTDFAATLDAKKRDVFVLALVEQLSIPEVAAILAIPTDTAYSRLRAVRQEFRRAIRRAGDVP